MSKLKIIDKEEYILEGIFEKIRVSNNVIIDEENVLLSIRNFKSNSVLKGIALGELNDGFLMTPVVLEDDVKAEEVLCDEKEPAFMIIDVYWDKKEMAICGKIIILDTEDGIKIKNDINQGIECYISSASTNYYNVLNKEDGNLYCRISDIGGYKISTIKFI